MVTVVLHRTFEPAGFVVLRMIFAVVGLGRHSCAVVGFAVSVEIHKTSADQEIVAGFDYHKTVVVAHFELRKIVAVGLGRHKTLTGFGTPSLVVSPVTFDRNCHMNWAGFWLIRYHKTSVAPDQELFSAGLTVLHSPADCSAQRTHRQIRLHSLGLEIRILMVGSAVPTASPTLHHPVAEDLLRKLIHLVLSQELSRL
jgi:hypothetical protein